MMMLIPLKAKATAKIQTANPAKNKNRNKENFLSIFKNEMVKSRGPKNNRGRAIRSLLTPCFKMEMSVLLLSMGIGF